MDDGDYLSDLASADQSLEVVVEKAEGSEFRGIEAHWATE